MPCSCAKPYQSVVQSQQFYDIFMLCRVVLNPINQLFNHRNFTTYLPVCCAVLCYATQSAIPEHFGAQAAKWPLEASREPTHTEYKPYSQSVIQSVVQSQHFYDILTSMMCRAAVLNPISQLFNRSSFTTYLQVCCAVLC